MNSICEQVRLAVMAQADAEAATLGLDQVQSHLASCPECRKVLAEMDALTGMLAGYRLTPQTLQVTAHVQAAIAAAQSRRSAARFVAFFLALVVILMAERAIVLDGGALTRWVARATACLLVAGWFLCQRENPFSVNPQLELTKPIIL